MNSPFPTLFSPIKIGTVVARNRIMRTATTANLAEKQRVTQRQIDFYRRLAQGGVGTIVTESVAVHPSYSGGGGTLQLYEEDSLPGLSLLTAAVSEEGATFICQLRHGGRQHHSRLIPTLWAPSAIACPHSGTVPHEMTLDDVEEVIQGFVVSARNAKLSGFHGVEIQGGNGHLIQEFISGYSNKRDDRYGGDYDSRLNFAREIIRRVRAEVGPDYVMGYRLGTDEFVAEGITLDESVRTIKEFAGSGMIDYVGLTQGNFYTIETHLPDRRFPPNTFVESHDAKIKAAVASVSSIPVVASGRIRWPEDAERILASGLTDMVGMCRQLIADPDWPNKALSGNVHAIRMCTNGNHCWGRIRSGDPIGCEINPQSGHESTPPPPASATRKKVVVVGAGPAGLEAARTAVGRGHEVLVYERKAKGGGKLAEVPNLDGYREIREYVRKQNDFVASSGVTFKYGTEATVERISGENPDEVVLATGAEPFVPHHETDGSVRFATSASSLTDAGPGETAILVDSDGDTWSALEAEKLALKGYKTVFVTRFFEPFRDVPISSRVTTLARMERLAVEIFANSELGHVAQGKAAVVHAYNNRTTEIENAAAVVWIGPQKTNAALLAPLRALGISVSIIGDAYAPRRLMHATAEGYKVASKI